MGFPLSIPVTLNSFQGPWMLNPVQHDDVVREAAE